MTDVPLPPPRQPVPGWKRGVETTVLALAGPALGFVLGAEDPFFASGRFFWPLLGPVVAGLRYGAAHGLGGAVLLVAGLASVRGVHGQTGELAAGTLALALVAGEFGDRWQRRIERLDRVARADHLRTIRLGRELQTLELSHAQLAATQRHAGESLAAALSLLGQVMREAHGDARVIHEAMLRVLSDHASLQIARFHPVDGEGRLLSATAHIGPAFTVEEDDPVVAEALQRRQLVCVDPEKDTALGPVLAAMPLEDSARTLVGLVVVHELPYETLRPAAMRSLATLCARISDLLTEGATNRAVAVVRSLAVDPPEVTDDGRMVGRVGT